MKTAFTVCVQVDGEHHNLCEGLDGPELYATYEAAVHVKEQISSAGNVELASGRYSPYVRQVCVDDEVTVLDALGEVVS